MYLFFYFVNNINMLKKLFDVYKRLRNDYKIDILVSANTFYTLLLVIPLNSVGFNFFEFHVGDLFGLFRWGIIFLINLLFVGSKYLYSLRKINSVIKSSNRKENVMSYIKALGIVVIVVLLFITLVMISFGIVNMWNKVIGTIDYGIIKLLESLLTFLIVTFVVGVIYKFVINIDIRTSKIIIVSLLIVLIWEIMSTIYQNINHIMNNTWLGDFKVVIFISFIYFLNYFIVITFFYNYWHYKTELKEEEWTKYIEH